MALGETEILYELDKLSALFAVAFVGAGAGAGMGNVPLGKKGGKARGGNTVTFGLGDSAVIMSFCAAQAPRNDGRLSSLGAEFGSGFPLQHVGCGWG